MYEFGAEYNFRCTVVSVNGAVVDTTVCYCHCKQVFLTRTSTSRDIISYKTHLIYAVLTSIWDRGYTHFVGCTGRMPEAMGFVRQEVAEILGRSLFVAVE